MKNTYSFVKINGGTIGYIRKENGVWIAKEYIHRSEGLVVTGKTKKATSEEFQKAYLKGGN